MNLRALGTSLFVLALPTIANAQTWTSPDGFLSVTPPDATQFQAIPTPPLPFVGLWVSNDESMKFGVMKTEIPPNIKLIQSSAEEGLAEEIGGQVTRLPTKRVTGHEVWNMTAKGPSAEITQAMVRHDGALYKLMAVTIGGNPDAASINRFIDSLSIVQPATQPQSRPVQDIGRGVDLHNLSKTIGGLGALLAIGLLVYLVTRGKKTRQT